MNEDNLNFIVRILLYSNREIPYDTRLLHVLRLLFLDDIKEINMVSKKWHDMQTFET